MNNMPRPPGRKETAPLLLLFLGVTALAAGLSALVASRPQEVFSRNLPGLADARDKAEKVQSGAVREEGLPAPVPPKAPAPIQAARKIDPDEGTRRHPAYEPVKAIDMVRPAYPATARAARVQGPVEVLVLVDRSGRPQKASVISGPAPLRQGAVEAAQAWRFAPARQQGRPVGAPYTIRFDFRLV